MATIDESAKQQNPSAIARLLASAGTKHSAPSIVVTEDELDRRAREAPVVAREAVMEQAWAPGAKITKFESMEGADYIVVHMSDGTVVPIERRTAFERASAVLEDLKKAKPGSMTRDEIESGVWRCVRMIQACFKNAEDRGLDMNTDAIKRYKKQLEQDVLNAERRLRKLGTLD